jgi:hypothetical protein
MSVKVRPVSLDSERNTLISLLERNLPDLPHARRFEWLYYKNPAGKAWSWFAIEESLPTPIGVASVVPRFMWIGESLQLCGQVVDFAIDAGYRSLGPAVLLQKATFDPVNRGLLVFCYDCPPDDRGMSTFRRMGMEANCRMRRFARPLRVDRRLAEKLSSKKLAAAIAVAGNFVLRNVPTRRHSASGIELSVHEGRFGTEFTELDRNVKGKDLIRNRRSAEDLNWRFRDDPLNRYEVLTARRGGELVGYIIVSVRDQDAYVIDLFGRSLAEIGPSLLDASVEHIRAKKIQSVHALCADESEMCSLLRSRHFSCREISARIVAYAKVEAEAPAFLRGRANWSFTRMDLMA